VAASCSRKRGSALLLLLLLLLLTSQLQLLLLLPLQLSEKPLPSRKRAGRGGREPAALLPRGGSSRAAGTAACTWAPEKELEGEEEEVAAEEKLLQRALSWRLPEPAPAPAPCSWAAAAAAAAVAVSLLQSLPALKETLSLRSRGREEGCCAALPAGHRSTHRRALLLSTVA
jgi:hypothetical protein